MDSRWDMFQNEHKTFNLQLYFFKNIDELLSEFINPLEKKTNEQRKVGSKLITH